MWRNPAELLGCFGAGAAAGGLGAGLGGEGPGPGNVDVALEDADAPVLPLEAGLAEADRDDGRALAEGGDLADVAVVADPQHPVLAVTEV